MNRDHTGSDVSGDAIAAAEWAAATPTSTLRWVATEGREFSDNERVQAAKLVLHERGECGDCPPNGVCSGRCFQ